MTKQRNLILKIIQSSHSHLTAEEIYLLAKKEMPSIAMGTVYRNLKIMCENHEIRRIEVKDAPDHYDCTLSDHDHLVCECCKELSDITIKGLKEQIANAAGVDVLSYDLNIHYICPSCQAKKKA